MVTVIGWDAIVMVVGGVLLGVGIGLTVGQRAETSSRRRLRSAEIAVRRELIPMLEERAKALGLEPVPVGESPIWSAVAIARELQRLQNRNEVAYSDTVDVKAAELRGSARRDR